MKHWSFACPDWAERLERGATPMATLPLDEAAAELAVRLFDRLCVPDMVGTPPMREAAGDWQRDVVRALFGSLETVEEGERTLLIRRVPELFLMVPKKNAKTTLGAALSLLALLLNKRPKAEMIYAGPTQEIADLAFRQATGMIEADAFLTKRFHVMAHKSTIRDRVTDAVLKVKTFDMKIVTGAKPVFVLVDEIHLLGTVAAAERILGQLRGGMLPNPEAMLVLITTQSDLPPAGLFAAELRAARAIRDGRGGRHAKTLPVIYEFPEAMQRSGEWRDPARWPMVLPNLGRSLRLEALVADFENAKARGEREERRWASQHLNVEIGLALHSDRWVGADFWEAAGTEAGLSFEALFERSEVVVFGVDGGGVDDLFGLAALGRERGTGRNLLAARAWAQPSAMEGRPEIAATLRDFEADGDLVVCGEGDEDRDFREAAALIAEAHGRGLLPDVQAVGLDPRGVAALVAALLRAGLAQEQLVAVPQGTRLASSIWGMERELKDRRLRHGGTRLMAWCVGNAKAEMRGNAIYVSKQAAGKAKIDPLVAAFNAFALMANNPKAGGRSYLESAGLMVLA